MSSLEEKGVPIGTIFKTIVALLGKIFSSTLETKLNYSNKNGTKASFWFKIKL